MKVRTTGTGNTTNTNMYQRGIPGYSVWEKSVLTIGTPVETITNYGRTCSTLIDLKLNQAQKSGLAVAFGLTNEANSNNMTLTTNLHGRKSDSNNLDNYFVSIPILNALTLCEKLVPLGHMPQVRIELELANLNKMMEQKTNQTADKLEIFNMELCYDTVNFGQDFEPTLLGLADENGDILIKTQGHQVSTQTADAIGGLQTLSFPQRLSSVKSVITWFEGKHANSINKEYDSVDVTNGAGSYIYQIGNKFFPDVELNTARNRAGVFMELNNAVNGTAHDILGGSMSISPAEFDCRDNTSTSQSEYGQFMIGANCERMSGVNQVLLTGQSTALTPITLNVRCDSAPNQATVANLLTIYDAILQINLPTRQASLKV